MGELPKAREVPTQLHVGDGVFFGYCREILEGLIWLRSNGVRIWRVGPFVNGK